MKKFLSILLVVMLVLSMIPATVSAETTEITFNLGANGSASHNDGSSKTSYSETVNGYTLSITNGANFYTGARDAKGNSCIKLGASSKAGSFKFTVPDAITSVVISAGKYKANTSKLSVNGTTYTLSGASNNGAYDAITVDTSVNKTVNVTTVSGGYRAMVNTIVFQIEESTDEPAVAMIGETAYATVQAAADDYTAGDVIKLIDNSEDDLVLNKDVVLDLNGKSFGGAISGEYTLYGMDSSTNDYDITDGTVGELTGQIQQEVTVEGVVDAINSYLAVADDDTDAVSFHAVSMAVTQISFRPSRMGLYYTAEFKTDAVAQKKVKEFGIALQVGTSMSEKDVATKVAMGEDSSFGSALSCLVFDIMKSGAENNANRATLQIYAKPYVEFESIDGEAVELTGAEQHRSLQQVIEKIDELYYRMSIANRGALINIYNNYKTAMAGWALENLNQDQEREMSAQEILEAAYQLKNDETLPDTHTLTGIITKVDTAYSSEYKNVTVTIVVDSDTEHPMKCFRMEGEGADQIAVGDEITVTGNITNYMGNTVEFAAGCTLDSWVDNTTEEPTEPTDPTDPENPTDPVEPDVPSGNVGEYVKITSMDQLTSGQYVLVVNNGYAMQYYNSKWVLSGKPTVGDGVITADNAAEYIWTLTVDGTSVKLTDAKGQTIKANSNDNGISTGDFSWTAECTDGAFRFAGTGVHLAANASSGSKFRGYKDTTINGSPNGYPSYFTLYKLVTE